MKTRQSSGINIDVMADGTLENLSELLVLNSIRRCHSLFMDQPVNIQIPNLILYFQDDKRTFIDLDILAKQIIIMVSGFW